MARRSRRAFRYPPEKTTVISSPLRMFFLFWVFLFSLPSWRLEEDHPCTTVSVEGETSPHRTSVDFRARQRWRDRLRGRSVTGLDSRMRKSGLHGSPDSTSGHFSGLAVSCTFHLYEHRTSSVIVLPLVSRRYSTNRESGVVAMSLIPESNSPAHSPPTASPLEASTEPSRPSQADSRFTPAQSVPNSLPIPLALPNSLPLPLQLPLPLPNWGTGLESSPDCILDQNSFLANSS
jgi:hypothetical protein